jgi:hypothetical protein
VEGGGTGQQPKREQDESLPEEGEEVAARSEADGAVPE